MSFPRYSKPADIKVVGAGVRLSVGTSADSDVLPTAFETGTVVSRYYVTVEGGDEIYVSFTIGADTVGVAGGLLIHSEGGPVIFKADSATHINHIVPSGGGAGTFVNVVPLDA